MCCVNSEAWDCLPRGFRSQNPAFSLTPLFLSSTVSNQYPTAYWICPEISLESVHFSPLPLPSCWSKPQSCFTVTGSSLVGPVTGTAGMILPKC